MENQPTTPPDNNLVWAILCTVLCCLPLGIVASNVNTYWAQGNYEAAQKAADDAKKFSIWGAAIALIGVVLYVLFFVLLGIGGVFAGF